MQKLHELLDSNKSFAQKAIRFVLLTGRDEILEILPEKEWQPALRRKLTEIYRHFIHSEEEKQILGKILGLEAATVAPSETPPIPILDAGKLEELKQRVAWLRDKKAQLMTRNDQLFINLSQLYPELRTKNPQEISNPALRSFYLNEIAKREGYLQDRQYFERYAAVIHKLLSDTPQPERLDQYLHELEIMKNTALKMEEQLGEGENLLQSLLLARQSGS